MHSVKGITALINEILFKRNQVLHPGEWGGLTASGHYKRDSYAIVSFSSMVFSSSLKLQVSVNKQLSISMHLSP